MCVAFTINHKGDELALTMVYPSVYPDAPPMIFSTEKIKLSDHQYGADGELCLEYRPDNWVPMINGADMIASAHRLISGETQDEHGNAASIISGHQASLGRDTRSKFFRLILTPDDLAALNGLPEKDVVEMEFFERFENVSPIATLSRLGEKDAPIWVGELSNLKERKVASGKAVQIAPDFVKFISDPQSLEKVLRAFELDDLVTEFFDQSDTARLLMGSKDDWRLFWVHGDQGERKMFTYSLILLPAAAPRLPTTFQEMANKSVGLIGCGSVGSKIAASLARSGITNFVFIDEDIFFPGNIARNELDYDYIGLHKADALENRLTRINPDCNVNKSRMQLGGQESSSSLTAALEKLGKCDVLIDAAASPIAFNMIASVSTHSKIPMIWGEVFAGGIGGYIARARPTLDPTPQMGRGQILNWCERRGVDWQGNVGGPSYEAEIEDGPPMVADDASVSIVAAHMSRYAIDILTEPQVTAFPQSAYMIGLAKGWAFSQPFETFPVALSAEGDWGLQIDANTPEEVWALIAEHLRVKEDVNESDDPA